MTPAETSPTLYELESTLQGLLRLRDDAEYEGDSEAVKVIDQQINEWALEHVKAKDHAELARKVDHGAHSLRFCEQRASEAKEAEERAKAHRKAWEARTERIKSAILWAMQSRDIKEIQSATNTFRVQTNGGLQPLETNAAEVPSAYKRAHVAMPIYLFERIMRDLSEVECREVSATVTTVDNDAIRATLKQLVRCPECGGSGGNGTNGEYCLRCAGRGTIPNTVPGCRLLDRGAHLRCL